MLGSVQGLPLKQQSQLHQQQTSQQSSGLQNASDIPPPPLSGQDFNLSSVLHFLQSEWRKYERDRNEWEIERAEMRARIALLEGERRSFENIKVDFIRRIKMLEYALRVERSKQLLQPGASQSILPSKVTSAQSHVSSVQRDDVSHKEGSNSSSPRSEVDSPLPPERVFSNVVTMAGSIHRTSSLAGGNYTNAQGPATSAGKPPLGRDPKSRARSRDYLKQCLQEIAYLTSPQAINPLPARQLVSNASSLPVTLPNVPAFDQMPFNSRPRKVMPEASKDSPVANGFGTMSSLATSSTAPGLPNPLPERGNTVDAAISQGAQGQQAPSGTAVSQFHSQLITGQPLPQHFQYYDADKQKDTGLPSRLVTAADPSGLVCEMGQNQCEDHSTGNSGNALKDEDESKDAVGELDDEDPSFIGDGDGDGDGSKLWKTKRTLRNHLDAVRATAFHPTEFCLITGGDDCTVKLWRMDAAGLTSISARPLTEVEPQLTLRGHTAAITKLIVAPSKQCIFSASLDSTIRMWGLATPGHTTYAPFDSSYFRGELVGHTDAVWDLALVRDESTLISCGAEGSVKVWDITGTFGGSLRLSWTFAGLQDEGEERDDVPGVTAIEPIKVDLKKVAVAYQNAAIKIFDIESGKDLMLLHCAVDDSSVAQVNSIVSHPTMPILITAHDDKYIRLFDIITGQCTRAMAAHLDSVTCLSLDAAGFSLVSGGHDCSIRLWDILGTRACIQEISSHREKAHEGVLDVQFHPSLPFMVSAGADGVVRLYASS